MKVLGFKNYFLNNDRVREFWFLVNVILIKKNSNFFLKISRFHLIFFKNPTTTPIISKPLACPIKNFHNWLHFLNGSLICRRSRSSSFWCVSVKNFTLSHKQIIKNYTRMKEFFSHRPIRRFIVVPIKLQRVLKKLSPWCTHYCCWGEEKDPRAFFICIILPSNILEWTSESFYCFGLKMQFFFQSSSNYPYFGVLNAWCTKEEIAMSNTPEDRKRTQRIFFISRGSFTSILFALLFKIFFMWRFLCTMLLLFFYRCGEIHT
jgi:hypothetical protein